MDAPSDVAGVAISQPVPFDFDAVFRSEYERIARVIVRVIQDPARSEELAVEAFWRLWRHPRAQGDSCAGWLHRTAVRLALDELRRRARRARYEQALAWIRLAPKAPDALLSSAEDHGRVRAVLAAISPRHAELLLLSSDGSPYREMASALALNPASVGTLLSRARQAFRKEYVKRYGEQD